MIMVIMITLSSTVETHPQGLGNLGLLTSSALVLLTARLNRTIRELRLEEVVDLAKLIVRAGMVENGVLILVVHVLDCITYG